MRLTDLTSLKQRNDESVAAFIQRFKDVKNRCYSLILSDQQLAEVGFQGLLPQIKEKYASLDTKCQEKSDPMNRKWIIFRRNLILPIVQIALILMMSRWWDWLSGSKTIWRRFQAHLATRIYWRCLSTIFTHQLYSIIKENHMPYSHICITNLAPQLFLSFVYFRWAGAE